MRAALATLAAFLPALAAGAAGAQEFRLAPLEEFRAVVERPLFSPDRRPRQAPALSTESPAPVVLAGIVIEPGNRYALVNEGTAALRRIAEGERLPAGTVKQILPDRVVLATPGGDSVVKLFERHQAANPTPADAVQGPRSRMSRN